MGVVSRRVVPACGNICFFCPSMRARSRQPVKRYKKLLSEIFPRSQNGEPNDRKIGKLCDYVSKNPLRIPKITDYLEQKCYKDLRHENFGFVKMVLRIYRKLLSSCKEQMPLFASSLLGIVRILLEQNRQDEMRILGCNALVDFISCQTDSTHMFNLEGLIPKLCQLAEEVGDDERALRLRSAGLQTLSYMVWFMGEHSHISMDFDTIVSVTLENYIDLEAYPENGGQIHVRDLDSALVIINKTDFSLSKLGIVVPLPNPSLDTSKCPSYWSRVCLYNMAGLAKEATTVRRVLEPLFLYFDAENCWSPEKGHAYSVLAYLQSLLQESGDKSHLLVSVLVKHLDHKNVSKHLNMQIDIANVIAHLSNNAKQKVSLAIVSAISDLIRHLRKCLQYSEASRSGDDANSWDNFQSALEESISQLSKKVGDVGPILDMIAGVLETSLTSNMIARATISAVYRVVQIVSTVPNISYHKKVFPDALFHQLLLAMAHPDNETRVKAHYVFSVVLVPSGVLSAFSKMRSESFANGAKSIEKSCTMNGESTEEGRKSLDYAVNRQPSYSPYGDQSYSLKRATSAEKTVPTSLRLSSHQVSLLLSSIWVQATSPGNNPSNFEAMAHSYKIALMFTRSKTSSHVALVRCFQLAFSLISISLDHEGGLQPSHRRSLFTFGSYMLILSSRAANLIELIPIVKDSLSVGLVDPYLKVVGDTRLQALSIEPSDTMSYGSEENEVTALKCLSTIGLDDKQLKETVISHFITKLSNLSEDELSRIKKQLQQGFSPDDELHLGVPLFMETPWPCSPHDRMELEAFDEVANCFLTDEDTFADANGSQSDRKSSLSINTLDIQSVGQLLESVLETARQVASLPVSSTPIPYDQMKTQCEALVTGKQQKLSVLQSFKNQEVNALVLSIDEGKRDFSLSNQKTELPLTDDLKLINIDHFKVQQDHLPSCSLEHGQSFRLPPSSPYDKFLKAAGC